MSRAESLPVWLRVACVLDRAVGRALTGYIIGRDEIILAYTPYEQRASVGQQLYARNADFLPGGARYASGPFEWEERLWRHPRWPREGRVLVGGAGGGREVAALVARGYSVVAFDSCREYVDALDTLLSTHPGSAAVHASLLDLESAVTGVGPLAATCANGFDAVVLGWAALSHLLEARDREAVFAALSRIAPSAPVQASFSLPPAHAGRAGATERLRRAMRIALGAMGAPTLARDGEYFHPAAGFLVRLDADDLRGLAERHGYRIDILDEQPFIHALLSRGHG